MTPIQSLTHQAAQNHSVSRKWMARHNQQSRLNRMRRACASPQSCAASDRNVLVPFPDSNDFPDGPVSAVLTCLYAHSDILRKCEMRRLQTFPNSAAMRPGEGTPGSERRERRRGAIRRRRPAAKTAIPDGSSLDKCIIHGRRAAACLSGRRSLVRQSAYVGYLS